MAYLLIYQRTKQIFNCKGTMSIQETRKYKFRTVDSEDYLFVGNPVVNLVEESRLLNFYQF